MSWETTLVTLAKTVAPVVEPDTVKAGTAPPYVTYQAIGGQAMRYVDTTAADKRMALVQINVWAKTKAQAVQLIRQLEDVFCLHTGWQCKPVGEYRSDSEPDIQRFGASQDFEIVAPR